jgi:flagellar basal-body rod protein FlgG
MHIHRINDVPQAYIGRCGTGVMVEGVFTIHTQGALRQTQNPFDFAIEGEGFFLVQRGEKVYLTRAGTFTLNAQGYLCTRRGEIVLGQRGPIKVEGRQILVSEDGTLFVKREEEYERVDRLRIVTVEDKKMLRKVGHTLFRTDAPLLDAEDYSIYQGFLESSNTEILKEMIELVNVSRLYEANQRVIRDYDATLARAIAEIPRTM